MAIYQGDTPEEHRFFYGLLASDIVTGMEEAKAFYRDVLGPGIAMEHGWIVTFTGPGQQQGEVSVATDGGSGTPVPHLSIEVDDVDEVLQWVEATGAKVATVRPTSLEACAASMCATTPAGS